MGKDKIEGSRTPSTPRIDIPIEDSKIGPTSEPPKPSAEFKEETKPLSDEIKSGRRGEKKVSGLIKQARLLGSLSPKPETQKTEEDKDWVMVPKAGEAPAAPKATLHSKIDIKEDYDPRAKRPTIRRVKAEEFYAKHPPGRPRAKGHTERTLPEMALDKRPTVVKADAAGERITRETKAPPSVAASFPLIGGLFHDANVSLRQYTQLGDGSIQTKGIKLGDQLQKMDSVLAKCEQQMGDTVKTERHLIKQTLEDSTILGSAYIASPSHALELKRLGLQPTVAGRVGQFTDVHLESEMKALGSGETSTVYAGKYTLPDGKGSFEGVFKPEISGWKRGVDVIPMAAYEIGIDVKNPRLGYRNVATTRLDELLGFGLTTRSEMAMHDSKLGTVSEKAKGHSPQGPVREGTEEHTAREIKFSDPALRRDLVRLQFMDHIAGQGDRHHGNYFVELDAKGTYIGLKGIDNDLSWGKKLTSFSDMGKSTISGNPLHLPKHLPPVIDRQAFNEINKLTPETLRRTMGGLLTSDEMAAAVERLTIVKAHLKELDKSGLVLDKQEDWGSDKVSKLLSEQKKPYEFVSYVGRDAAIQEDKRKSGLLTPYSKTS